MVIDSGARHEAKIKAKRLACPPLAGYNHLAVYLKWAYGKGLLSERLLKAEPRIETAVREGTDLREVIATGEYMNGKIRSTDFTKEGRIFTEDFYRFECHSGYPACVDNLALQYFRKNYYSREFADEAYLFVPYDEAYCKNLTKYIEEAWDKRDTTEEIVKRSKRRKLNRDELVLLVDRIRKCQGTEKQIDKMIEIVEKNVVDPEVSNYIFYEEITPEEAIDKALSYQPILL